MLIIFGLWFIARKVGKSELCIIYTYLSAYILLVFIAICTQARRDYDLRKHLEYSIFKSDSAWITGGSQGDQ